MGKLITTLVSLLLVPILFAAAYEAYLFIGPQLDFNALRWFVYGMLGYVVMYAVMGSRMEFIEIFEHELSHMLVATLFFQKVHTFVVTTDRNLDGGLVRFQGSDNFLITLAPYFLPIFTLPFLILKALLPTSTVLDLFIGFTLAFHYIKLSRQFRTYQPDIKNTGLAFSFIIVGVFNVVILVLILCVVRDDYTGLRGYFASTYHRAVETYRWIVQKLKEA